MIRSSEPERREGGRGPSKGDGTHVGPERLRLLASALAGRPVAVAPLEPTSALAWTDGWTIFVDAAAGASEQVRSLSVQASLLAAGSLNAAVLTKTARRPALAKRYLAVEGHRALAAQEGLLPATTRPLVDARMAARSGSPSESLAIASSREEIVDPPLAFGTIRPRQVRAWTDGVAATAVTGQHIARAGGPDVLHELDDEEDEGGSLFDGVSSPVGGGGVIGRLLKKLLGDARASGGGPPGSDAATHWTRQGARSGGVAAVTSSVASIADVETAMADRQWVYPEWDAHRLRYRRAWCTVSETSPTSDTLAPFDAPDTHVLRRALARLGRELQRQPRQLQGIDIDLDAAVAAQVDAAAGWTPAEEVYIDILRQRRDLAVLILLDISGSAAEPSTSGGIVHEHQRAAAAALMLALHGLGDRVALYSFRSQGRSAVHVVPMKRFGEPPDATVLRRLGGSAPGAYTRLGAAIRHGSAVLEREGGTSRRLLVVLSDGFAYDHGYEGSYGEADARRALSEARRRGAGCLCLSIGTATETEALRRVFGTAAHAHLPLPEQLASVVGPLFQFALRSAEAQQRSFQRTVRTMERDEIERSTA